MLGAAAAARSLDRRLGAWGAGVPSRERGRGRGWWLEAARANHRSGGSSPVPPPCSRRLGEAGTGGALHPRLLERPPPWDYNSRQTLLRGRGPRGDGGRGRESSDTPGDLPCVPLGFHGDYRRFTKHWRLDKLRPGSPGGLQGASAGRTASHGPPPLLQQNPTRGAETMPGRLSGAVQAGLECPGSRQDPVRRLRSGHSVGFQDGKGRGGYYGEMLSLTKWTATLGHLRSHLPAIVASTRVHSVALSGGFSIQSSRIQLPVLRPLIQGW